jgi:nucleotide-binding universal stress UspA family protein
MLEPEWQEFLHELPIGGGLAWEKQTREGYTAQTIADVAKEIKADLVVMGTHGRTGLTHMLLGSVAEQVVHNAECSVLTLRSSAHRFELP